MAVRIDKVDLPGIGTRHDLMTSSGRRIGVVSERTGEREIVFFDADDPDAANDTVSLTDDEAGALVDILGGSLVLSQLAGIRDQVAGLYTEQVVLPAHSPYAGHVLGDTQARSRTGASIVAVIRNSEVIPAPTPQTLLEGGDTLIAVGTRSGLDALTRLLDTGVS
jgi:TrkA domain protein